MLILERRPGESILIYPSSSLDPDMRVSELFGQDPIRISIRSHDNRPVKIAISAPEKIKILREELKPHKVQSSRSSTACTGRNERL